MARFRPRNNIKGGSTAAPLWNPRGQIKMFETVGVLVVFFFLLATGSIFYFGAQKSALQKEKIKASEQYAFQIVLKSLYLPELDCSFLVTQKDNCVDRIKLNALAQLIATDNKAKTDYYSEFGYATINVSEAYPGNSTWTLYENVPTERKKIQGIEKEVPTYTAKLTTQSPILIYDAWQDSYAFGVIEVAVYVQ